MTIKIIGTSHISAKSIKEVEETISNTKPSCVAVELCPARFYALSSGRREKTGFRHGALIWLFSWLQKKLGEQTGILPGSEMLAAVKTGKKIGAKIVLIDKNIEDIILSLKKIPVKEKVKLFLSLFLMPFAAKIKSTEITEDIIDDLLKEMKRHFPVLYKVLVHDRNIYMAKWARRLEKEFGDVVIVVGLGHKKGIEKILLKDK